MKKTFLLFIAFFSLLINGCTIIYDSVNDIIPPSEENPEEETDNGDQTSGILIDKDALFYPQTLTTNDKKIVDYNYIYEPLSNYYTIYSAYYSEKYDTIYIAYDSITSPKQTLKAKDLYEIEQHAINYFVSDENRSEDSNYLKAVRIYPDRLASACRNNKSDSEAMNINGCADYGGLEAIIDLNNLSSLEEFYKPKYSYSEPMRDTFAHEYGHISTFYHMAYKSDENYEDYLKLRLGSYYNTVYPSGLPNAYDSDNSTYTIQPEEILADDFVELFYDTSTKLPTDKYEYELNYTDKRRSLENYSSINIHYIKDNPSLFAQLRNYYSQFINYNNRNAYEKPIIISTENESLNYYESLSHIGNTTLIKNISDKKGINLIALGDVTIGNTKYYRVILSSVIKCKLITDPITNQNALAYDKKDIGENIGYVEAIDFVINTKTNLYTINRNNKSMLSKNNVVPLKNSDENNLYILPFYDHSFVLNDSNDDIYATMYDYLNDDLLSNKTIQVNIDKFGTLIK